MTWQQFFDWLSPFVWGFIIGFVGFPIWTAIKKIWREALKASRR